MPSSRNANAQPPTVTSGADAPSDPQAASLMRSLGGSRQEVLLLCCLFHSSFSQGDRHRFFSQMRRATRTMDFVLVRLGVLCMLMPLTRQIEPAQQQRLLAWLTDQVEPRHIVICGAWPFERLLEPRLDSLVESIGEFLPEAELRDVRNRITALLVHAFRLKLLRLDRPRESSAFGGTDTNTGPGP